jgi:tetratricopeptide (TPR) repeat protein
VFRVKLRLSFSRRLEDDSSVMENVSERRQSWLVCLGLALAVLAAYGPLWSCGFVRFYDDGDYVLANQMIQHGVNAKSLAWAFTTDYASNWHPLAWISHAVDFQVYGTRAAGHHATSLALHLANSILLFLLLRRMTKAMWPSAAAAAFFALHPMHVESVAWVSERKDVLSALFWLLTIWAYVRYAEECKRQKAKGKIFYILALFFFALGLMAKPMAVTLPFALLLLDYWPLERGRPAARWVVEKAPFFILAAACCVVAYRTQQHGGALAPLSDVSVGERLLGVPMSYLGYIGKTLWPARLAVLYPLPLEWPVWRSVGAGVLLALVTTGTLFRLRTQPYLAVGWLWFLGTLVPVIGLVQVGVQFMADRYNYIPSIGLAIMIVWAAREWAPRLGANAPAVLAGLALAGCLALTWLQVGYWKNDETLFRHTLDVTAENGGIEGLLGECLLDEGRAEEALPHLQRSAELNHPPPGVLGFLGKALLAQGRVGEAFDKFVLDVNLTPDNPVSQFNLGCAMLDNGLAGRAVDCLQKAVQLRPEVPEYHYKLGNAFLQTGRAAEAMRQYEEALRLRPDYFEARVNLAWILACSPDAALRDGARAVQLASRADQLSGGKNPRVIGTLAAAYAEAGRYSDAIATVRRALQIAGAESNSPVAGTLRTNLALYQAGTPLRDPALETPASAGPGR